MDQNIKQEAVTELSTIGDMVRWAATRFSEQGLYYGHGSDNAWDEALQLILPVLNMPLENSQHLVNAKLTTTEKTQLVELIARRIDEQCPVAYLTNKALFAGLEFYVDERVLVPRSPFAELIHNGFAPWLNQSPQRIMDLCTGSGCIAIACAYAFPEIGRASCRERVYAPV